MTTPAEFLEDSDSPLQVRTNEGMVVERSMDEKIKGKQFSPYLDPGIQKVPWGIRIARVRQGSTI